MTGEGTAPEGRRGIEGGESGEGSADGESLSGWGSAGGRDGDVLVAGAALAATAKVAVIWEELTTRVADGDRGPGVDDEVGGKSEPLRVTGNTGPRRGGGGGRGGEGRSGLGSSEDLDGADAWIAEDGDELDGDLAGGDGDRDGGVDGLKESAGAGEDVEIGEDGLAVDEDVEEALAGLGERFSSNLRLTV